MDNLVVLGLGSNSVLKSEEKEFSPVEILQFACSELEEILDLIQIIGEYEIVDSAGFPEMDRLTTGTIGSHGSCVVPLDLAESVVWLHEFLFGEENYQVTDRVQTNSDTIDAKTSEYLN